MWYRVFQQGIEQSLELRAMEDKGYEVYARFKPESSFNTTYFD